MSALVLSPTAPPSLLGAAPRFSWDVAARLWTWSPEMCLFHGYAAEAVGASTEQTLGRVHPNDLHGWVDAMHAGMYYRRLVVHEHRLVDRAGRTRPVLLVARPLHDAGGLVQRVDGLVLPLDEDDWARRSSDEAPELVLMVMSALGLSQHATRTLLGCCAPVPAGWGRHRLQVVGQDGSAETPSGSVREDVAAALFTEEPAGAVARG